MVPFHLRLLAASLLLPLCGCVVFAPEPPDYQSIEAVREPLDSSDFQARPMPEYIELQSRVLGYFPNRLLDLLDLFKVSLGAGPGVGLELYLTDNVWISYLNYRSWRMALDGRASGIYEEGQFCEWHLGDRLGEYSAAGCAPLFATDFLRPYEAPLKAGVPAVAYVPKNDWDVGVKVHLLIGAEVLVRPFELFDFLVGLWGDDPAEDDYGLRRLPLHEYAPQGQIIELFINAIDQLNPEDLKQVLASDLRRHACLRKGLQLVRLGPDADTQMPMTGRTVTDRGEDYLLVGDVRIEPHIYRNPETGSLDFSVACTNAVMRWGVPAQLDYSLTFFNRFVHTAEKFELSLRVENEHWVITRMREVDQAGP